MTTAMSPVLVIVISSALFCLFVLHAVITIRFLMRKNKEVKQDVELDDSFIHFIEARHPFKAPGTKCFQIQPRTYDDLRRVIVIIRD